LTSSSWAPLLDTVKRTVPARRPEPSACATPGPSGAAARSREKEVTSLLAECSCRGVSPATSQRPSSCPLPRRWTRAGPGNSEQHAVPVNVLPGQMADAVGISERHRASGTATLRRPSFRRRCHHVQDSPLTAGRQTLVQVRHIGLVNIIAGKTSCPNWSRTTRRRKAAAESRRFFPTAALRCIRGSSQRSGRSWRARRLASAAKLALD